MTLSKRLSFSDPQFHHLQKGFPGSIHLVGCCENCGGGIVCEVTGHTNTPGTGGHLGVGATSFMWMTVVRVL